RLPPPQPIDTNPLSRLRRLSLRLPQVPNCLHTIRQANRKVLVAASRAQGNCAKNKNAYTDSQCCHVRLRSWFRLVCGMSGPIATAARQKPRNHRRLQNTRLPDRLPLQFTASVGLRFSVRSRAVSYRNQSSSAPPSNMSTSASSSTVTPFCRRIPVPP